MTAMLKLRKLLAVLAVYDRGSASGAASFMHMSQPAATGAIAAVEADLGVSLFARTSRGMDPTPAGRIFCRRVAAAFDHLKAAETLLQHRKGPRAAKVPFHRLVSEGQLHALSAVVHTGGFSRAAQRLGLAAPSVHKAARELEVLCGVPLWQRDRGRVMPTQEARALARLSDLAFAEIRLALDELQELQGKIAGTLAVGALPLARSKWLPMALSRTLARFPDAKVNIVDGPYDELLTALDHGRIDFILGALRNPAPAGFEQQWIFDDPLLILVRADHPFAHDFDSDCDKLTPEQLGSLSWILPRRGTPARENFEIFMSAKGLSTPRRVVECSSLVATRGLLLQGDHAALLSRQQVEIEIAHGLLKVMGPPLTGSVRPIGITRRQDFRLTRLQEEFLGDLYACGA